MKRMKKFQCLILIFLSLSFSSVELCNAQQYIPIPLDSIRWHMLIDYNLAFSCHERHVFEYGLNSDTVIGAFTYKKVTCDNFALYFHDYGNPYCSIYSSLGGYYFGAVRQDTSAKKVFYVPAGSNMDSLLYDFNLATGDTLFSGILVPYQIGCPEPFDIVTSVDSVSIGNVFHRRWNFQCIQPIVDGIGSVFNPFGTNPDGFYLTCVTIKDTIYEAYGWGGIWDSITMHQACNFVAGISDDMTNLSSVSISPNPFHSTLYISSSINKDELVHFKVLNLQGEEIKEGELNLTDQKIDMTWLPDGFYFLNLKTENYYVTKKIIKCQ